MGTDSVLDGRGDYCACADVRVNSELSPEKAAPEEEEEEEDEEEHVDADGCRRETSSF